MNEAETEPEVNDDDEVLALYREHSRKMVGWIIRTYQLPAAEAEAITTDVFLIVRRKWAQIRGTYPRSYAYTIAGRLAAKRAGRAWRDERQHHHGEIDVADDHDDINAVITKLAISQAIEKLPPAQRDVITARHIEGLSIQETAQRLGISQALVKSRTHEGMNALRRRFVEPTRNRRGEEEQ